MTNLKYYVIVAVIAAGAGAFLTYKLVKPETITKIVEVEKEKIVYKRHTIVSQGRTEIIETGVKTVEAKKDIVIVEASKAPDWLVSAGYNTDKAYDVSVSRRILGPAYLGVGYDTNRLRAFVTVQF